MMRFSPNRNKNILVFSDVKEVAKISKGNHS